MSTAILARVLTPEDFGLVAMSSMAIGLIQTFSELGTARLLIRIESPERSHYDTAWTISLLQSIVIAGIIFVGADLAARYFSEPRVSSVIRWCALTSIISGVGNIGIINLRKELQFRKDFIFGLCCKLSVALSTVPLALYLRSYWALVAGGIAAGLINVGLSYVFSPYRPRLSLERWPEFLRFSLWITPSNLASYFLQRLDTLVVGAVTSTTQLGLYHFASEVSKMATGEIIIPMGRVLYPTYAKLISDRNKLARAYLNVVRTTAIVCFAVGPGLAVVADDFVHVLLGEQWVFAVPLVRFLAISGALASIVFVLRDQIFIVTGNERLSFWLYAIQLAIAAPTLIIVGRSRGVVDLAASTTVLAMIFVLIAAVNVRRAVPISFGSVLATFVRPLLAALAMVYIVQLLHWDSLGVRPLTLTLDVVVGAVVYISTLLLVWRLTGRPEGPESGLVDLVKARIASKRGHSDGVVDTSSSPPLDPETSKADRSSDEQS
jgi:O-antigen/teichoic acid export membrane protein